MLADLPQRAAILVERLGDDLAELRLESRVQPAVACGGLELGYGARDEEGGGPATESQRAAGERTRCIAAVDDGGELLGCVEQDREPILVDVHLLHRAQRHAAQQQERARREHGEREEQRDEAGARERIAHLRQHGRVDEMDECRERHHATEEVRDERGPVQRMGEDRQRMVAGRGARLHEGGHRPLGGTPEGVGQPTAASGGSSPASLRVSGLPPTPTSSGASRRSCRRPPDRRRGRRPRRASWSCRRTRRTSRRCACRASGSSTGTRPGRRRSRTTRSGSSNRPVAP